MTAKVPLTIRLTSDKLTGIKLAETEKKRDRRMQRGTRKLQASYTSARRTTPEPPGTTGTGPPVTEDLSGSRGIGCKQGGTVEPSLHPWDFRGWSVFVLPRRKKTVEMVYRR